jgi:hypothetical protein
LLRTHCEYLVVPFTVVDIPFVLPRFASGLGDWML